MLYDDDNVLLSSAMIVRDEERFLADCLRSIQAVVDEIVIIDTGSTDQTVSIAKKFNARVFHVPWRDDFAAARNEALARCQGKWILSIDADERLEPEAKDTLLPFLLDNTKVAFTVRFYFKAGYTPFRRCRIFRNHSKIKFEGLIHETVVPSIKSINQKEHPSIGKIPLTIRHIGYNDDQTNKHRRNLELLRREVKNAPERAVYLWWHLGCVLKALNDEQGAQEAWTSGINIARQHESYQLEDSLPFGELIRLYFEKGIETDDLLRESLQWFPDQYFLLWLKAMIDTQHQNYTEAVTLFERLIAVDPEGLEEPLAYEAGIFGKLSYEPLAACYYKLGKFKESVACYRHCEQYEPENPEYKIKRQFLETKLGKSCRYIQ